MLIDCQNWMFHNNNNLFRIWFKITVVKLIKRLNIMIFLASNTRDVPGWMIKAILMTFACKLKFEFHLKCLYFHHWSRDGATWTLFTSRRIFGLIDCDFIDKTWFDCVRSRRRILLFDLQINLQIIKSCRKDDHPGKSPMLFLCPRSDSKSKLMRFLKKECG